MLPYRPVAMALAIAAFAFVCLPVSEVFAQDAPAAQASPDAAEAERLFLEGRAHFRGEGAPQDDVRARELLLKSAQMGNVKAMNNLGMMYADGRGGAADGAEAVKWLTKAADAGVALSQMNLGSLYADGKGVNKDGKVAAEWLRKAANQGLVEAQAKLGLLYFRGLPDFPVNYEESVRWFTKADAAGNAVAENALGVCYEQGLGVGMNIDRAAELFKKAAAQGDPKGMSNLGRLYTLGKGVPKDPVKAYSWLILSARKKEVTAENLLADYKRGLKPEEIAEGERIANEFKPAPPRVN